VASIEDWDSFYSDITIVFALNAQLLQGRRSSALFSSAGLAAWDGCRFLRR
jgi:hypothetical protein